MAKNKSSGPHIFHGEASGVVGKSKTKYLYEQSVYTDVRNMTSFAASEASYDAKRKMVLLDPLRLPKLL